ncbi:MAG: peptidase S8 and S53, subtilisin, kexin, sedolisin [Gemmatimonas sp.]|nr:peptidase S8 and S53, subtilisin, kexin, sedolisin [Gemmatimonas sp.]
MSATNFLIGRGELLTAEVPPPKRIVEKAEVYGVTETRDRLSPQLAAVVEQMDRLPDGACPENLAVARVAINPSYLAKSFFPGQLLRHANLESVGSRAIRLTPRKWSKKSTPCETATAELFVAGSRSAFRALSVWISELSETVDLSAAVVDATRLERVAPFRPEERIRGDTIPDDGFYEVGIHLLPGQLANVIRTGFESLAQSLEVRLHSNPSFEVGSLWFLVVEASAARIRSLAEYSFVRIIRPLPRLRGLLPSLRHGSAVSVTCQLPRVGALSLEPRVAILDGGLPDEHQIAPWLRSYTRLDALAPDDEGCTAHGLAVTSAFLFGPITPAGPAQRPFAPVDHLRVLDRNSSHEDPLELYRTLGHVEEVLLSRQYEFINLSLGPALPVDDTDVHAWTSVIDEILSDGNTFLTVAAGNNGAQDRASGNARIQVPADCVNAVAVGAANSTTSLWRRADYSAMGPGRSPGVVKPDLLGFGGEGGEYFHVLSPGANPELSAQLGTSFSAPLVLRNAVGVRAVLGPSMSPLAIKALLVHSAETAGHPASEVGWGRVPESLDAIIVSPPGVARVVYQGELRPGKYLRAKVPMPATGIRGLVTLRATFCFASRIDPQDTVAYTKAGLQVTLRPNVESVREGAQNAKTKAFFEETPYATEHTLRADHGKWETVLHGEKRMRGSSLHEPAFDVHYNARDGGGPSHSGEKIPYALVISLEAPQHVDLYAEILAAYPQLLVPIRPLVPVPVRV